MRARVAWRRCCIASFPALHCAAARCITPRISRHFRHIIASSRSIAAHLAAQRVHCRRAARFNSAASSASFSRIMRLLGGFASSFAMRRILPLCCFLSFVDARLCVPYARTPLCCTAARHADRWTPEELCFTPPRFRASWLIKLLLQNGIGHGTAPRVCDGHRSVA